MKPGAKEKLQYQRGDKMLVLLSGVEQNLANAESLAHLLAAFLHQSGRLYNAKACLSLYEALAERCGESVGDCIVGFKSLCQKLENRMNDEELQQLEVMYFLGYAEFCDKTSIEHDPKHLQHFGSRLSTCLTSSCGVLYPLLINASELWIVKANQKISQLEETARQLCLSVLLHWESEDHLVIRNVKKFLDAIFTLEPSTAPEAFRHWITETLIGQRILFVPLSAVGPVVFPKGTLHCLKLVLKFLGPVELLKRCPYLTTNLLIALGHNYTAATAADVLIQLLSTCTLDTLTEQPILTSHIIDPLIQYIVFERLDCTVVQESLGSVDTPVDTIRNNRRINFAHQCLGKDFANLRSTVLSSLLTPEQSGNLFASGNTSLVEALLNVLNLALRNGKDSSKLHYHRHFLWLHLFNLYSSKLTLGTSKFNLTLLLNGLFHADDHVRALALSGLANLAGTILNDPNQVQLDPTNPLTEPRHYMSFILLGTILLNGSTNPVARKLLTTTFGELLRAIRNGCTSLDTGSIVKLSQMSLFMPKSVLSESCLTELYECVRAGSCSSRFLQLSPNSSLQRKTLSFQWLCHLIQFFSALWGKPVSDQLTSNGDSHSAFWPGMTYQRMKVNLELMYTTVGLLHLNLSGSDMPGQWCTGYAQTSIKNIRRLVDRLATDYGWQYNSLEMLHALLDSLRLLKPDLQSQLLELVDMIWTGVSSVLTDVECARLLGTAQTWCDSYNLVDYTAGGKLLLYWYNRGCGKTVELQQTFTESFSRKLTSLCDAQIPGHLLTIALREPGLGYLIALDGLFATLEHDNTNVTEVCFNSVELIELCLRLSNKCLIIMGCEPWSPDLEKTSVVSTSHKGASSFRELGESILRAALGRQLTTKVSSTGDQHAEADAVNYIQLRPEYQHVLSWAWNSLRYSASILSRWAVLQATHTDQHVRNLCTHIGYQLVHILLHCRHRGTVEAVCASLQHYLSATKRSKSNSTSTATTPLVSCEQVLNLCWTVLCQYEYSVTRRAAGLWPAVKAALLAEQARKEQHGSLLLTGWLMRLIDLAHGDSATVQHPENNDELLDSPRALALHLLRGIFSDARLRPHLQPVPGMPCGNFLVRALEFAVIPTFGDADWTVANAGLQLHSALVLRLTGTNSGRPPPPSTELFRKYPTLLQLCLRELEEAAKLQSNELSRTTKVIPILTLLARVGPGEWSDSDLNKRARATISHFLLNHTSLAVREMAAVAYLVFLPYTNEAGQLSSLTELSKLGPLHLLNTETVKCHAVPVTANAMHGQLCLLRAWLTQSLPALVLRERKTSFHWDNAFNYLDRLLTARSSGAFLLAHYLCDLMTLAVDSTSVSRFRSRFSSWLLNNAKHLFSPTATPFHLDTILSLYRLTRQILDHFCYLDLIIEPTSDPVLLHRLLCIADEVTLGDWVSNLLNYWVQNPVLHQSNPMLCWRIVEIWSSLLFARKAGDSSTQGNALTDLPLLPLLKSLLQTDCGGDAIHQSRVVLCAAACIDSSSQQLATESALPWWWLRALSHCLSPTCPDTARSFAAEAILVWNERVSPVLLCSNSEQCRFFIKTLFFALFDGYDKVRTRISCFVHRCLSNIPQNLIQEPVCHLLSVIHLLDDLIPCWLQSPDSQLKCLYELWSSILDALFERITEERLMRQRQVLYELEMDNDFCEPRLLFQLLFERLAKEEFATLQQHTRILEDMIVRVNRRLASFESPPPTLDAASTSSSPSMHALSVGMSFLSDLRAKLTR